MSPSESNPENYKIRRSTFFSGNVQGVGFRYTTCRVAGDYNVHGYVKNLLDGRVEIVAEGFPAEVDRFVQAVHDSMKGYIEYVTSTDSTATGEFDSFAIAY